MRAGALRHTVEIQEATRTADAIGQAKQRPRHAPPQPASGFHTQQAALAVDLPLQQRGAMQ